MIDVERAISEVLAKVDSLPTEHVPTRASLGRTLRQPLLAQINHPPFDQSAMDGWAVIGTDLDAASEETPVSLQRVGESRAGQPSTLTVTPGSTVRIFTGAMVPNGADTVIMQEDVGEEAGVAMFRAVPTRRHIRKTASACKKGDLLVQEGAHITAGVLATAASQGLAKLTVSAKPRVAILATGDELTALGQPLRPGAIYDSNGPMLAALVEEAGAIPTLLRRRGDDASALVAAIEEGLSYDLLLTSGGVSVGDHDLVRAAMEDAGVEPIFWKIAMKPGKPVAFGVRTSDGTPVVGLPGNPTSTYVTFLVIVAPMLRKMLGQPPTKPLRIRLDGRTDPGQTRDLFVRCSLSVRDGELRAYRFQKQNSGIVNVLARADAILHIPRSNRNAEAVENLLCDAILLRPLSAAEETLALDEESGDSTCC